MPWFRESGPGDRRPREGARARPTDTSRSLSDRRGRDTSTAARAGLRGPCPLIRIEECADGEAVPEVMEPRPTGGRARRQAGAPHQAMEGPLDIRVQQPRAGRGDEHRRRPRRRARPVTASHVGLQRVDRARIDRHLARFSKFGQANRQHVIGGIDIATVEREGFPDSHASDRQESEQRAIGGDAMRRAQRPRRGDERAQLVIGVEVGSRPRVAPRQDVGGWHLRGRIDCMDVDGEAAHDREAVRRPVPIASVGSVAHASMVSSRRCSSWRDST